MFNEKCPKCRKKIEKNFEYCPYCGCNIREEREIEDFGLLGKEEDKKENFENNFSFNLNLDNIFDNMNSLIKNIMRDFDKEFKKSSNKIGPRVFSKGISINFSQGKFPEIKIISNNKNPQDIRNRLQNSKTLRIPKEKLQLLANLPKEEPKTQVRRLSDKIIYTLDVPGVKDKRDIIINKLEKGIEINAISKEKVFIKRILLKLEPFSYKIENGKLEIEFKV